MRILHLYRPRLPSTRAQAIQVLRTCHALAERGHAVTVLADRGQEPDHLWLQMGLEPLPTLDVQISPFRHPGLAGLWFRRRLKRWWGGPPGIVLARDKRRLLAAIDRLGKRQHTIVLETHEHESGDGDAEPMAVESRCLEVSDALVANCGGTLEAWATTHPLDLPTHVCHNASHIHSTEPSAPDEHVLVLGSFRKFKGVDQMIEAMEGLPFPVRWIGAEHTLDVAEHIRLDGPVPHAEVQQLVHRARVLVAPLGDNRFSHHLTSPLKLWDYLGTARPIVTAETAATDEIMRMSGTAMHRFEPGNVSAIQAAIRDAWVAPPRAPFRRTWQQRASELESIFTGAQHA